ncbi:MAG: Fpg/Nei family DNA glycosylase [Verrucomicrobiales bacterium]|nr:Fpg/Nei family DNA glycosylase [Verrucomicrobiales bacterium]
MPELAEVEYYLRQWSPGLGKQVEEVLIHPKARIYRNTSAVGIRKQLTGETLLAGHRHGKQWLFEFSGGNWLGGHLGMTGKLHAKPASDFQPGKHDHLVLQTAKRALVFTDSRMFGKVSLDVLDEPGRFPDWWEELPPEVLDSRFTPKRLAGFMKRHQKPPIKTLLLDQRMFPGIGNWMADEICWRVQIHPATPVGNLSDDQLSELWKQLRTLSRQALRVIGTNWDTPPNSWLFNHRWKDGGNCPRKECKKAGLVRINLRGRTTAFCPSCQSSA